MPNVMTPEEVEDCRAMWSLEFPCVCPADAAEKKLTCTSCRMFFIVRKYGGKRALGMLIGGEEAEVLSAL